GMDEARRLEPVLLEIHEREPPGAALDRLPTAPAARAPRGRPLGAVEPRQPAVLDPGSRGSRQRLRVGDVAFVRRQRLEERLGTLVCRAAQMEPQRRFAVAEHVRHALAEADITLLDPSIASAALCAGGL